MRRLSVVRLSVVLGERRASCGMRGLLRPPPRLPEGEWGEALRGDVGAKSGSAVVGSKNLSNWRGSSRGNGGS